MMRHVHLLLLLDYWRLFETSAKKNLQQEEGGEKERERERERDRQLTLSLLELEPGGEGRGRQGTKTNTCTLQATFRQYHSTSRTKTATYNKRTFIRYVQGGKVGYFITILPTNRNFWTLLVAYLQYSAITLVGHVLHTPHVERTVWGAHGHCYSGEGRCSRRGGGGGDDDDVRGTGAGGTGGEGSRHFSKLRRSLLQSR